MNRVFLSAGERSGDAHAADVACALRAARPTIDLEGVGGPRMDAAGVRLLDRIERLSAMGLAEAARSLPAHVRLLRRLKQRFTTGHYDLAVLVDYPGFHLRVARVARKAGVPVLYYIAPQLWAWGEWRLPALRAAVSEMAVILPFEQVYFQERGVAASFVGHPLLDRRALPGRTEARSALGVGNRHPVLALFPGSRPSEITRIWPVFREAACWVRHMVPDLHIVVAATPGFTYGSTDEFVTWWGGAETVFAAADVGLCKSGTTTLEAALAGMPMVIGYRLHALTYAVARRAVRVPHVGLVNLIAGRTVVPEYLQRDATPDNLGRALLPLLERDGAAARVQRTELAAVCAALGEPGAARRVADVAARLVA